MSDTIRVLGVTGSIASGKSTVAKMFAELGAAVVSADELAREVVVPGEPALSAVVAAFGAGVLRADGRLDRDELGRRVFADPAARKRLEAILHPAIRARAEQRLAELRRSQVPLVVYEAPLLFEAGAEGRVDAVLTVTVDEEEQLRRVVERDGLSVEEARRRIAAQMPQAEKAARSDFRIDSGCSLQTLRAAVAALYGSLVASRPS